MECVELDCNSSAALSLFIFYVHSIWYHHFPLLFILHLLSSAEIKYSCVSKTWENERERKKGLSGRI